MISENRMHVISEGVVASYIHDIASRRPAHRPIRAAAPVVHAPARRRRPAPAGRPARRPVTVKA